MIDYIWHKIHKKIYLLSTKSKKCYTDVKYEDDAYLVFGPETRGLPEDYILLFLVDIQDLTDDMKIQSSPMYQTIAPRMSRYV